MCNRVGKEGDMDFKGASIVVDEKEQIVYANIDINEASKCRSERPYISFRRPDVYSEICNNNTEIFKYKEN